jgi:predicted solute-binding protein
MKTFQSNYSFLSKIFLKLVSEDQVFKTRFQAFAPEIYADIESASTNPNCSCRQKVEAFVNTNKEKTAHFLNLYLSEFDKDIDVSEIEKNNTIIPLAGTTDIVKIAEWKEFYQKLVNMRAGWRNFSLIKLDDETVQVFFI